MLFRGLFLSSLLGLLTAIAMAKSPSCPMLQEEQLSAAAVNALIKNPACNIRSIPDVLSHLPESYRKKYVNFYRSRSLQGPHETDYKNPRAVVVGENSNLMMTFNGDSKQAGNLGLEMVEINTEGGKDDLDVFKYYEVQFPYQDEKAKDKSWQDVQSHMSYSDANPKRCAACHGSPARPIYPGYPLWEGSFGSTHGRMPNDQPPEEMKGLEEYLKKVRSPEASRYKLLPEAKNSDQMTASLMNNDSINGRLGNANGVRVARMMLKTPDYDKYKYALIGAFLRCEGFENFIPSAPRSSLLNNLENKYQLKAKWPESKQNEFINQVYLSRNLFLISDMGLTRNADRESTPFPQYLKKFKQDMGGSEEFKRLQIDTFATQDIPRADPLGANLRMVMEGRGLNIDNWFLDLTQPTYRYHNGGAATEATLKELAKIDPSIDKSIAKYFNGSYLNSEAEKEVCNKVQQLSLKALDGVEVPKLPKTKNSDDLESHSSSDFLCEPSDISDEVKKIKSVTDQSLDPKYPKTFTNTCAVCHDSAAKIAPHIPFSSSSDMSHWLAKPENKALIKGKLLNPDETRRMPPTRKLEPDELKQVLNFIGRQ